MQWEGTTDCLRAWRKRRKLKKKAQRSAGLLKWNQICNVDVSNSSNNISTSTDSETDDTSSQASPKHCWCSSGAVSVDSDDTTFSVPLTTLTTTDQQVSSLEDDTSDENDANSERDTDSLVAEIFAIDAQSSKERTKQSGNLYCVHGDNLFSNDPLYVKMLEYNYAQGIQRLKALQGKALQHLQKPFH